MLGLRHLRPAGVRLLAGGRMTATMTRLGWHALAAPRGAQRGPKHGPRRGPSTAQQERGGPARAWMVPVGWPKQAAGVVWWRAVGGVSRGAGGTRRAAAAAGGKAADARRARQARQPKCRLAGSAEARFATTRARHKARLVANWAAGIPWRAVHADGHRRRWRAMADSLKRLLVPARQAGTASGSEGRAARGDG